jgi:hypothetical protein
MEPPRSTRIALVSLTFALGSLFSPASYHELLAACDPPPSLVGRVGFGLYAYRKAQQITAQDFKALDDLAFKLENGLLKLVESLERKQETGDWIDSLIIKESNTAYG